jgi:Fe-S-cluster-containing dehydrogenase component
VVDCPPMRLGFLIDHDLCIGCHACTVACKAENEVPVGAFRTWVKYQEHGRFPEVRRHFAVLRCNHCDDAPCVRICPVRALIKRPDGIVDVDREACIGCRACMQACPYDALYVNEDLGTVEKCHFCAHRVEKGLEPACVVVCPERAIVAGDLDDPDSPIGTLVRENRTLVRRAEQGTGPNVHYKGVEASLLEPGAVARPATYLWSQRPERRPEAWPVSLPVLPDARVVLDAEHRIEWGWQVAAYLVTKGVAAGVMLLAPFAGALGVNSGAGAYVPEVLALGFTLITTALLVEDLRRPAKFLTMLTRPNWRSWLVRGAIVLMAYSGIVGAGIAARILGFDALAAGLRWAAAIVALGVAGYTAFLFDQCEGRDLWQGRLLGPHLIVQAVLCGAVWLNLFTVDHGPLLPIIALAAGIHGGLALLERYGRHGTANARQAAAFLGQVRLGPLRAYRDGLVIGAGVTVALAFILPELAVIPAMAGLFMYEWAYVRAGQLPPLA